MINNTKNSNWIVCFLFIALITTCNAGGSSYGICFSACTGLCVCGGTLLTGSLDLMTGGWTFGIKLSYCATKCGGSC